MKNLLSIEAQYKESDDEMVAQDKLCINDGKVVCNFLHKNWTHFGTNIYVTGNYPRNIWLPKNSYNFFYIEKLL